MTTSTAMGGGVITTAGALTTADLGAGVTVDDQGNLYAGELAAIHHKGHNPQAQLTHTRLTLTHRGGWKVKLRVVPDATVSVYR